MRWRDREKGVLRAAALGVAVGLSLAAAGAGDGLLVQPLANGDFLEPSVRNEVDHALAQAFRRRRTAPAGRGAMPVAWTNGLNGTDAAIRLVSRQRADGAWFDGTNDVTYAALSALRQIAGVSALTPLAGDGDTDDTDAIQERLDLGGEVCLPPPKAFYRVSRTLVIGSDTTLRTASATRLALAPRSDCLLLRNRRAPGGDRNIRIVGGIWDFANRDQYPSPWLVGHVGKPYAVTKTLPDDPPPKGYNGYGMYFESVDGLVVTNVTLRNPTTFGCALARVTHFDIADVTFDYPTFNPVRACMDGIHLDGGCRFGRIANLRGACWDDTVALNSNDEHGGPAVSEGEPITDILIDGLVATNSHSAVRLLSTGGDVRNITIRNVRGTFYRYAVGLTHFFRWDPSKPRGRFDNITIEDCAVGKAATPAHFPGRNAPSPVISVEEKLDVGTLRIERLVREERTRPEDPTILVEPTAVVSNLVLRGCRQATPAGRPMVFLDNRGKTVRLERTGVEERAAWPISR